MLLKEVDDVLIYHLGCMKVRQPGYHWNRKFGLFDPYHPYVCELNDLSLSNFRLLLFLGKQF